MGMKITLALPQHKTIKNDILLILEFFNRAPHLTCEIFSHGGRASPPPNALGPGMAGPTLLFCGNGEEEREGCSIEGATVSDYIHKRAE
jgi:hypothetical protein